MALQISSPAFRNNEQIPRKYTCDGENISPELTWQGVAGQVKSFVLICDDPDAPSGTFTHWVLYNIPGSMSRLPERASVGTSGLNSFGKTGFGGPCPPKNGGVHHYHFRLYALDIENIGGAGFSKESAMDAMTGHVLAEGDLVGTYQRP